MWQVVASRQERVQCGRIDGDGKRENMIWGVPSQQRDRIHDFLQALPRSVRLRFFSDDSHADYSPEVRNLLHDLSSLTTKVEVEELAVDADPSLIERFHLQERPAVEFLYPSGQAVGLRFYGFCGGFELNTLLSIIEEMSTQRYPLLHATLEWLRRLPTDVHLEVYYTPTCTVCPHQVALCAAFALAAPQITVDCFEASEYPARCSRRNVIGVPRTFLQVAGRTEVDSFEGAMDEGQLVAAIRRLLEPLQQ